jgi:hypothetical protein
MDEHEHGEGDEVQACQGFGQALAIARLPTEAFSYPNPKLRSPTCARPARWRA